MIDTSVPRAPGQYDPDLVSDKYGTDLSNEKSLTMQEFANDADINVIMKRFGAYRELPLVAKAPPEYGDFSRVFDFHTAMNEMVKVQDAFEQLPAEIRDKFKNDPGEMWNFVNDPANLDKAKEFGLLRKDVTVEAVEAVKAAPAAAPDAGASA